MSNLQRPQQVNGSAPEPPDLYWLVTTLPESITIVPPTTTLHPEEEYGAMLVAGVLFAVWLLITLIACVALVA